LWIDIIRIGTNGREDHVLTWRGVHCHYWMGQGSHIVEIYYWGGRNYSSMCEDIMIAKMSFIWQTIKCIMRKNHIDIILHIIRDIINLRRLWLRKMLRKTIWNVHPPSHYLDQGSIIAWTWSILSKNNLRTKGVTRWSMVFLKKNKVIDG